MSKQGRSDCFYLNNVRVSGRVWANHIESPLNDLYITSDKVYLNGKELYLQTNALIAKFVYNMEYVEGNKLLGNIEAITKNNALYFDTKGVYELNATTFFNKEVEGHFQYKKEMHGFNKGNPLNNHSIIEYDDTNEPILFVCGEGSKMTNNGYVTVKYLGS